MVPVPLMAPRKHRVTLAPCLSSTSHSMLSLRVQGRHRFMSSTRWDLRLPPPAHRAYVLLFLWPAWWPAEARRSWPLLSGGSSPCELVSWPLCGRESSGRGGMKLLCHPPASCAGDFTISQVPVLQVGKAQARGFPGRRRTCPVSLPETPVRWGSCDT